MSFIWFDDPYDFKLTFEFDDLFDFLETIDLLERKLFLGVSIPRFNTALGTILYLANKFLDY